MSLSSPSLINNSDESHPYHDSPSSSSFSTSSSCSSPDVHKKEYTLLNDKSRRKKRAFIPDEKKDPLYWSQRSKNNLSAKRSRVKRRMNDLVLETKVTELNNENQILRAKIDMLARKFGHLANTDEEDEELKTSDHHTAKPTSLSNLLDQESSASKTNSPEGQSLLHKPTTTVPSPMPIKWRFKLFNMSSNS